MADISKLQVPNGTTYDIKDSVARAHAVTNKGSAFASGMYKITTNAEGHVTAATAIEKIDILNLGVMDVYVVDSEDVADWDWSESHDNGIYLLPIADTNPQEYNIYIYVDGVVERIGEDYPELMTDVKSMLAKYGLDTTTVYTYPIADVAQADCTVISA